MRKGAANSVSTDNLFLASALKCHLILINVNLMIIKIIIDVIINSIILTDIRRQGQQEQGEGAQQREQRTFLSF